MQKTIDPNYRRASNIIFTSAALTFFALFIPDELGSDIFSFFTIIFTTFIYIGIQIGLGYFARRGANWIKYVLAVLLAQDFLMLIFNLFLQAEISILFILSLIQHILGVWAMVLLFKAEPKPVGTEETGLNR